MNDDTENLHIGHHTDRIRICERCWTVIEDGEPYVALAHVDRALPDGTVLWNDAYLHAVGATAGRATRGRSAPCPV